MAVAPKRRVIGGAGRGGKKGLWIDHFSRSHVQGVDFIRERAVFLPFSLVLLNGRIFGFSAIIRRGCTAERQNSGILAPRFSLLCLRGQVALKNVPEVRLTIALTAGSLRPDRLADDAIFMQQVSNALVGDRLAALPFGPRLLRIGRQALDDGLGGEVLATWRAHLGLYSQTSP